MSHFTVAIITKGEPTAEIIEKALAPYQENNMGDCPKEYMEFHSLSEEYKEAYETGKSERVRVKLKVPIDSENCGNGEPNL